jgi:vacuolar protein sorting-associated protein 11
MALTSVSWFLSREEFEALTDWIQWKTFDFFEVSQIRPPDDEGASFLESNEISCVCSGSDNLFLGSYDGIVRILSSNFKVQRSFQAHDVGSITHMKQVEGTALLVTIAVCTKGS